MTSDLGRHLHTWEARAALAEARAEAEARRARRAERVAVDGPESLRALSAELAEVHRRNEERHRTAARMHRSLVQRAQLAGSPTSVGLLLAHAVADASRCPSSAIVLLADDGSTADFVGADGLAEAAQDLEFVHDEGPLHSVCARGEARLLTGQDIQREWPHYGQDLAALGISTVVAAPLRAGAAVLGAVGLFDPPSATLGGEELAAIAGGVTPVLLDHADAEARPGGGAALDGMRIIHQAAGFVASDVGCDVPAALALLRARAFVCGEPAATIAQRILDGELHLSL
ncbi:GAF domain-containing protein [Nocardioides sp. GXQ0305]|uniref:GAF domain-containing protein n=1 Tax=Nocardioides sp. GXQ0305 TaxID=3423912 RepID=UPI003D7EBB44